MPQNLQWARPLTSHAYSIISFVVVRSVYMKTTPAGTYPYVDARNAITGAPFPAVEVLGVIPTVGQRGFILHIEGDANTVAFLALEAPTVEEYIPLLSWYTTVSTSGTPEGVVGYPFPGHTSTEWAVEVVGTGDGSVTVGNITIPLTSVWTRIRTPYPSPPSAGTILTPTVTVNSTTAVSLSLIALVSQSYQVYPGGGFN